MNANELADVLEDLHEQDKIDGVAHLAMPEAADMLRQQAEQINNLQQWEKRQLDVIEAQQAEIEALKNRNWELVSEPWGFDRHPAKTLTDEEIKQVWETNLAVMGNDLDFARAILRKAQEK